MIEQAIILCGGKGSRLKHLTKKTPKPLLNVNKKPFIEYQIENLARHGIKEIFYFVVINIFYLKKNIIIKQFIIQK